MSSLTYPLIPSGCNNEELIKDDEVKFEEPAPPSLSIYPKT